MELVTKRKYAMSKDFLINIDEEIGINSQTDEGNSITAIRENDH